MEQGAARLDREGHLHLGPRVIPIPTSISAGDRRFLATPVPDPVQPEVSDTAAWKSLIAATDQRFEPIAEQLLATVPATVAPRSLEGVTVQVRARRE